MPIHTVSLEDVSQHLQSKIENAPRVKTLSPVVREWYLHRLCSLFIWRNPKARPFVHEVAYQNMLLYCITSSEQQVQRYHTWATSDKSLLENNKARFKVPAHSNNTSSSQFPCLYGLRSHDKLWPIHSTHWVPYVVRERSCLYRH